jgi:hypothetical protein
MVHSLRTEALAGPRFVDSQSLVDYLFFDMAYLPTERLRVMFLNTDNRLIYDETMAEGSVNETPIYPREIMRRSLEVGATALILAHNHPSGDPARAAATSRRPIGSRPPEARSESPSTTMSSSPGRAGPASGRSACCKWPPETGATSPALRKALTRSAVRLSARA